MTEPARSGSGQEPHSGELQEGGMSTRLNWLRAGVLGANDGIVSTAGIVVGVAGAGASRSALAVAGIAGLVAGALSMAAGEYVSVSTQRDAEQAMLRTERHELHTLPAEELEELTQIYQGKGLTRQLAEQVAHQLTEHDALAAHAEVELRIDPDELTNPWAAAWASLLAFTIGALLPLIAVLLSGPTWRVPITMSAVVIALAITGYSSARLGEAPVKRAMLRNVAGGVVAMAITYGIGNLVGLEV